MRAEVHWYEAHGGTHDGEQRRVLPLYQEPILSTLTSAQRKWLRGQAHPLKPIVRLGKQGLTEAVLVQIDAALEDHELIKVQAVLSKEGKEELSRTLAQRLRCQVAGLIGHVLILYRRQPDPEKRRIELP